VGVRRRSVRLAGPLTTRIETGSPLLEVAVSSIAGLSSGMLVGGLKVRGLLSAFAEAEDLQAGQAVGEVGQIPDHLDLEDLDLGRVRTDEDRGRGIADVDDLQAADGIRHEGEVGDDLDVPGFAGGIVPTEADRRGRVAQVEDLESGGAIGDAGEVADQTDAAGEAFGVETTQADGGRRGWETSSRTKPEVPSARPARSPAAWTPRAVPGLS
jgi:hypothetical protein